MENARRQASASDRDLVIAFKAGDGQAYDEIYRRHSPKIRAVCSRRLGQSFDTDEAVQETFLRAYQALGRFNGQYRLGAWLNRIAVNVCIDQLRSRSRSEIVDLDEQDLEAELGPDDRIAASRPEVVAALRELKPLHADVLRLRALHELSHEELAAHLSISPAQAKALLHRARLAFKRVVREASGFIVAPLAMLRRPRRNGQVLTSSAGGCQALGLLTTAQLAMPLAERLMTGAVVAALALGGGTATTTSPSDLADMKRTGMRAERRGLESPRPKAQTPPSTPRVEARSEEVVELTLPDVVPDDTAQVAETVTETVKQKLEEHRNETDPGPHVDDKEVEQIQHSIDTAVEAISEKPSGTASDILGDS